MFPGWGLYCPYELNKILLLCDLQKNSYLSESSRVVAAVRILMQWYLASHSPEYFSQTATNCTILEYSGTRVLEQLIYY
jgi:hypothetical protein